MNLNGRWEFAFDAQDRGLAAGWTRDTLPGGRQITVPFPWGSALSGVPDSANIGWYSREVVIPASWAGKRVFVVFGASDWTTTAWVDGVKLGEHRGGYTPFSFEITGAARTAGVKRISVRVDDSPHPFKLEGKQGYGQARGMWQTVYLEARGADPVEAVHYTPRSDLAAVGVDVRLREPAPRDLQLSLAFTNRAGQAPVVQRVKKGATQVHVDVPLPGARRWSLDDPFLHTVTVSVTGEGMVEDRVQTYFGMRTVSVVNLPGTEHPYVALNGVPVYLQIALDQAYHPDGFYTFPTDSVLRNEILLARQIGLNALREHIKIETPRKLYWADRLGVLIMADVPNWWGQPDSAAFRNTSSRCVGCSIATSTTPVCSRTCCSTRRGGCTRRSEPTSATCPRPSVRSHCLSSREVAGRHAADRGQLDLLRQGAYRDGPEHVARVPARLALGCVRQGDQ